MDELKRCPFCGGKATFIYLEKGYGYISDILFPSKQGTIKCKKCGITLPRTYTRVSNAVKAWNRRVEKDG